MAASIKLDVSNDFEEVCNDFMETVTLKVTGSSDCILVNTLSEPQEIKELEPTGAKVTRNGTLFVWSKKRSSKPPLGSQIVDHDGTYWTIWKLVDKQHVECWEAFCLNLNIVTATENVATVLVGSYVKGRANEAKVAWKGYWSGVANGNATDTVKARFQPSEETARLEFGSESSYDVFRVYFDPTKPMDLAGGEYRLVDSAGYRYRVIRYYQEERIDRLPVAIAVKITEGKEFYDI